MGEKSVCDFCGGPAPVTAFPLKGFTAWESCEVCAKLVRECKDEDLAKYACEQYCKRNKCVPREVVLPWIFNAFHTFWVHWDTDKPEIPFTRDIPIKPLLEDLRTRTQMLLVDVKYLREKFPERSGNGLFDYYGPDYLLDRLGEWFDYLLDKLAKNQLNLKEGVT